MRRFEEYNPIAAAIFFLTVTGTAMFCSHPAITGLTLFGAVLYFVVRNGTKHLRSHISFLILFILLAAINPLISHNGRTVLFVLNDNPITLEALLYGVNSSAMMIGILYWFRSFTQIMTSDRLLYIFGTLSPKLSLVLSMALRFVPLFSEQSKKVNDAQKAMGMYKEDNAIDNVRGGMRVFSVMVTWGLENGIITADSMAARGYGTGHRTNFTEHRFRGGDIVLLAAELLLFVICVAAIAAKKLEYGFYPDIEINVRGAVGALSIAAYGVLVLIPVIIEAEASIKWKYLKSRI